MKRIYIICALLLLSVFLPFSAANAQKSVTAYLDCTDSQQEYGALVSKLNKKKTGLLTAASAEPAVVLCRTDGGEADFSRWAPLYVLSGPDNCRTLIFSDKDAAKTAAEEIARLPGIRYAECDAEIEACQEGVSFRSWGAEKMNFGQYLDFSAANLSGTEATVAVIDSGVFPHNDFKNSIKAVGYDYVDSDADPTNDVFGHGTSVAGIVGDCTRNLPVYILPIRILNAEGRGSISDAINAIREAIGKGADIINLSLSMIGHSEALDEAIADALSAGVCVVAAAGNDSRDTVKICPAHIDAKGVIVVGSVESDGSLSSYSNYGESVDVYAYGTNISCCTQTGGYASKRGTSFSAPHVSALAAVIKLTHPAIRPAETEERICAAANAAGVRPVPDAAAMIPRKTGFFLKELKMNAGESVELPLTAYPEPCCEKIILTCNDDTVAAVSGGQLRALKKGTAVITASCLGLEDMSFSVTVDDFPGGLLKIPAGTKRIEAEAFADCENVRFIEIPSAAESIGDNAFPDAVLLCGEGSAGEEYAEKNGAEYICNGGERVNRD